MPRRLNISSKLVLSIEDTAYALSIAKSKVYNLVNKGIIPVRANKIRISEIEKLLDIIYSDKFPNNINNLSHRALLIETFCNAKEKINILT